MTENVFLHSFRRLRSCTNMGHNSHIVSFKEKIVSSTPQSIRKVKHGYWKLKTLLWDKMLQNGQKAGIYWSSQRVWPGQRALQLIFCTDMPSQNAPPFRGAGLVQVRERFWTPLPQFTLHGDHSVHKDQPPFTAVRKRERDLLNKTTL